MKILVSKNDDDDDDDFMVKIMYDGPFCDNSNEQAYCACMDCKMY